MLLYNKRTEERVKNKGLGVNELDWLQDGNGTKSRLTIQLIQLLKVGSLGLVKNEFFRRDLRAIHIHTYYR